MKNLLRIDKTIKFIILLGLVSLFSDITYEAARSLNGSFLKILGASGTAVGLVAGAGELIGYGLRLLSGWLADRTKKYWLLMITGYALNLFSVPLLALAGYWEIAVVLMIAERTGKAIRTPSRDALLSFGTQKIGRGWGFGLHEAMDQIGATVGPLLVSSVLLFKNQNYSLAYAILAIPAIIAFTILLFCKYLYPTPGELEIKVKTADTKGFPKNYWVYLLAVVFVAAGFADFPLIAFRFKSDALFSDTFIPVLYSIAMVADALAALIIGKIYDRAGIKVLLAGILISSIFAPLVFLGDQTAAVTGMILWGIGMGAQESVMRAEIAGMVPHEKRGTAYGTFNAAFGIFWFAGSAMMGILYDNSIRGLVIFSVATQLIAVLILAYSISAGKNKLKNEQL